MERAGVLIEKLQEQYKQNADPKQLLITVQMLMKELSAVPVNASSEKISVILPNNHFQSDKNEVTENTTPETKEETKPVATPEIIAPKEPEPQPMNGNADANVPSGFLNRWYGDTVKEIPTLAQREFPAKEPEKNSTELNESMATSDASLNEKLRIEKIEIGSVLQDAPIRDLRKAIGLNERYRFINELFRGDETTYERSIKTINDFHIYAEAEFWIKRELKLKFAWNDNSDTVKEFDQLIKRRFS